MVISKSVLLGVPTVASGASLEPQKCVSTVAVPLLSIQAACEDDGVPGARFRAPPEAGDTNYCADVPGRGPVLHPRLHLPRRGGGAQAGAMADREPQLPAPQYAVTKLNEKDFWHMFDTSHYELCRQKYRAAGTFMSVYYKSKKGRKTEKEVQEAEATMLEPAYSEEA